MGKRRKTSKCNYNYFNEFSIPPCVEWFGSHNPFVRDGKFIYKNYNRVYFFLSFNYTRNSGSEYDTANPFTFNSTGNGNLQIELYCFLIALYINEIEKGNIEYDKEIRIHDDENADKFIKTIIENNYEIDNTFIPSLTYLISNSNAVIPFFTGVIEISMSNFYIILMISRFYSDYGLLFSDNAYVTNDFINRTLANIYIEFNTCNNN